ncbi:MAG: hypothetical protein GY772_30580 [bacterium]|nr:hypothetical protein [bacterium]
MDLGGTAPRYFPVACRDVLAEDTGTERIRFLGNLDRDVFGAVLGNTCGGGASTAALSGEEAVAEVATKYRERLQQTPRVRATRAGLPRATWQTPLSHAASSAAPQALRPRVIEFDPEGKPLTQQDAAAEPVVECFAWHSFMATAEVTLAMREEQAKSFLYYAICTFR